MLTVLSTLLKKAVEWGELDRLRCERHILRDATHHPLGASGNAARRAAHAGSLTCTGERLSSLWFGAGVDRSANPHCRCCGCPCWPGHRPKSCRAMADSCSDRGRWNWSRACSAGGDSGHPHNGRHGAASLSPRTLQRGAVFYIAGPHISHTVGPRVVIGSVSSFRRDRHGPLRFALCEQRALASSESVSSCYGSSWLIAEHGQNSKCL